MIWAAREIKRSNWETLVTKLSAKSIGQEAELTFGYKTPLWLDYFIIRLGFILTIYYLLFMTLFIGDQGRAFFNVSIGRNNEKPGQSEVLPKYETVYYLDRPKLY